MTYKAYLNGTKFFDTSIPYEGYTIVSGSVEKTAGAADAATIKIPPQNVCYNAFNKLIDSVSIVRDDEEIFFGRVYGVSGEFNTIQTVTCEGCLAVLNDSLFPPETYSCSTDELIDAIVENHNEQCPTWPLVVGKLEVSDTYIYRAYENYESSKTRLDDLIDSYGGYFECRHQNDVIYLDWLDYDNSAVEADQSIDFGENLIDVTQESTAADIITALIPLGATVSEEDDDGETTEYVVDITSVNDGNNYIYDEDAVSAFGWIWGTNTWDDVTEPANLLTKAEAYLEQYCDSKVTINVTAVDLASAGEDVEHFSVGEMIHVTSSPHGLDEDFLCSKITLNLLDPSSDVLSLGATTDGLVSTTSKNYKANVKTVENIIANYATNTALSSVAATANAALEAAQESAVGITSITEYYAVSSDGTTAPDGDSFSTDVPFMSTVNRYLWNYEVILYTDESSDVTDKRVIGVYGDTGSNGVGVDSITEYYLRSSASTGITTSSSGWSTTIPTITSDYKYLWNYEVVVYTDDSTTSTEPAVIGVYGDNGDDGSDGVGISDITEYYARSSSNSTSPTSWSTTVPTITSTYKYLWNYEVVTYTDDSTTTTTPAVIGAYGNTGASGSDGEDGIGISSIENYYGTSSDSSTQPTSWSTDIPDLTESEGYLWNYEVITFTDGTKSTTDPAVIGAYGDYATSDDLEAVQEVVETHTSEITQLSDVIGLYVNEDSTVGSTVIEALSASIELTAEEIAAEVTRATEAEESLSSSITQTADAITAEVTRATEAEESLSSSISLSADEILSTVSSTYATTSYVDQTADSIEANVASTYATKSELDEVDDKADEANETASSAYSAATSVYGTCATAASTAAKVVTCSDFVLFNGASIAVTFTYANTAGAITLNVNSTGAKSIYVSGATASTSNYLLWSAGTTVEFVYNGSYWLYAGGATSYKVTCGTAAATAAKTATQAGAVICKGTNANVTWTYGSSYEGAITFNLGSTAAKTVYYGSSATSSSNVLDINATETFELMFSGAYWYVADSASLTRNATLAVTVDSIDAEVSSVYESTGYSLEEIANLAITAESITSTVSETYATTKDLDDTTETLSSSISQTAEEITATVSSVADLATAQTGSNLLQDGGFESEDYWTGLPTGMSLDSDNPHSGTYCLACTNSNNSIVYLNHPYGESANSTYNPISVEPGETYRITAYCMVSDDVEFSSGNTKIRLGSNDGNNTLLASLEAKTSATEWTKRSTTWTNTTYTEVQILIMQHVTSGTVWWDDIRFELDTATSDYVASMIRVTTDGLEVAKIENGDYTATRTLIDDTGMTVLGSDGTTKYLEAISSGVNIYDNGVLSAAFSDDGVRFYSGGSHVGTIKTVTDDEEEDGTTMLITPVDTTEEMVKIRASDFTDERDYYSSCYAWAGSEEVRARLSAGDIDNSYARCTAYANYDGRGASLTTGDAKVEVYTDIMGDGGDYVTIKGDYVDASSTYFQDYVTVRSESNPRYRVQLEGASNNGWFGIGSSGETLGIYDSTNSHWITYEDSNGYTCLYGSTYLVTDNYKRRIRYTDCGTVTVSGGSGSITNSSVTFNVEFESTPYVFVTCNNTSLSNLQIISVSSRTTTGCSVYILSNGTGTYTIQWVAIGFLS